MKQELSTNTNLSHYRIVSKIGAGGMGEVYLAEDARLRRKIALKVLPESIAQDTDRLRRFEQEAFAASALNHPNILTIYEFGAEGETHFLASEFIEGETLRTRLQRAPLTLNEALDIAVQTAQALAAAHAAHIIHRDIKPENVMMRQDGIVKVLDFGLAKLVEPTPLDTEAETRKLGLTQAGTVMGTVAYMSPEQARGQQVDARSDVWSLGCVLYELLTRRQPFTGETINHIIVAILEQEPPPLAQAVPAELERILKQALAKKADARYPNAQALLADLKKLQIRLLVEAEFKCNSSDNEPAEAQTMMLQHTAAAASKSKAPGTAQQTVPDKPKIQNRWLMALLSLLVLVGGFFGYRYFTPTSQQIESIAVMPFVNASGNADVEYLSDGMTETLISSLSQLPNLNVKARSSVFRYKGKEFDLPKIAQELKVQAILTGRVMQRGEQLTLSLELVDARTENAIWSEQYNRKQVDLVTLQSEIARDVSSKLKAKLSGADEQKLTKTYTANPEAYQLYLKGNYYRSRLTEEGYKKGLEYYRQAIAIDPNYALAYAGIAGAYVTASDWYLSPNEAFPKVKAAALKALELDNTLAEAHPALFAVLFWYELGWVAVAKEIKRATELKPNAPGNHHVNGLYLGAMGRFDEAITEMKLAQRLGTLDLEANTNLVQVYYFAGQYDQAIEQSRQTIEMDQNYWYSHLMLGLTYERKGQFPEAITEVQKAHSLDNNPWITGYLGHVYAAAGKKAEAQKVIDELKELSKRCYVPPYSVAIIYAGLNEKDQAFEWLNKAYEARSSIAQLKVGPIFDKLHSDPRFKAMLKRLNLPE